MENQKTYIISGAGSGIGRSISIQLAKEGHQIVLVGRNLSNLNETKSLLNGNDHFIQNFDVSDKEQSILAAKSISDLTIDGIIANAGVGGENNWGENDRWNEIVNTNLTGTYNFVNAFKPNLSQSKASVKQVLITSSVLARLGVANYTAYCASKAGLLGLMRSWAIEFAPQNILVNAIAPGWVDTNMAQEGLQGIADGIGITKLEFFDMAMESVPLRKMSEPQEIADLVSYLLKQKSITGQTIDINAGSVMNS
jgi:NAD(P)-dependent dehydrogenase (short-subunit alcohol dehydrogenase family)